MNPTTNIQQARPLYLQLEQTTMAIKTKVLGLLLAAAGVYTLHSQSADYAYDPSGNLSQITAPVSGPPVIVRQPQQQIVAPGELAAFSVLLQDATGCSYQWFYNNSSLAGRTADTLLISTVATNNQGSYWVVVNNSQGSVTSSLAPLYIDSRGSGMPDSWQMTFFGNLNQNASGDFDGDGVSNLQEFLDGTNPKDPTSFRSRLTLIQDGGTVSVTPDQLSYFPTNVISLSATAIPPGVFSGWTGDLAGKTNPATLVMNTNKTVRAVFECFPPISGLVGWWRAEGDASDFAGGHGGGFYSGSNAVAPSIITAGVVGSAFQFFGTNYVRVPDSADLRPSQFTLEGWIYVAASSGNYQTMIAKGSSINEDDTYYLGVVNGSAAFWSKHSGSLQSLFGGSVPAGQWTHLAATFDGATKRLYVNGSQVGIQGGLSTLTYDSQQVPLTIGSDWASGGPNSLMGVGAIDEVSLFSRALSPSEVAGIVVAGIGGKCSTRPVFTISTFPDALQNTSYSLQLSNWFGVAPFTFSISAGSLPAGLALSPAGLVSGIPTAAGSNVFAIVVTDAVGASTELVSGLRVIPRPPPGPAMPPGIVSWWRAENDARDWVGSNNGSISNGVTFAPGEVGQAFAFAGATNQEVFMAGSPSLDVGAGDGFTIESWINPSSLSNQIPVVEWNDGSTRGVHFWINVSISGQGGPGSLYADLRDANQNDHWFVSAPGVLSSNTWQHVALTFHKPSGIAQLFLNGTVVAWANLGSFTPRTTPNLYLGASPGLASYAGRMDEIALFNRSLSTNEVAAIYFAGPSGKASTGPYLNSLSSLPDGVIQSGYTQALTALSSTGPVTFGLGTGALPPGINLSPAGVLSGIPTALGFYTFTVTARDSTQAGNTGTYSLQIFAPTSPPQGLIGWWRGESNAVDQLGIHNGTLKGNASYGAGRVGTAFRLDGNNSYVDLGPWSAGSNWTAEAWVKPEALPGGRRTIFGNMNNCYDWGLVIVNGELGAQMRPPGGCSTFVGSGIIPAVDSWYHLAVTCDGQFLSVYVNGALRNTSSVDFNYVGDSADLRIGSAFCCGEFFQGSVDEPALYNRALLPAEVALLYGSGGAGKTAAGPYFTTAPALAPAVVGQGYTQAIATVLGSAPVTVSQSSGTLPPGLSLSSNGTLMGVPTNAGNYAFVLTATDALGLKISQSFAVSVFAQVPPPAGISGWWRGESNTVDSVGTNTGVLINSANFAPGKVGTAFSFIGPGGAVEIEDAPALRPVSVTLEAWVLFLSTGGSQGIISKPFGGGTADSYQLWLENGSLKGVVSDLTGAGSVINVPFTPILGQWYHVAFTFDDSNKQQVLYINGTAVAFGISNVSIGYDGHPVFLGADVDNGNMVLFLSGRIDEAAIYNRALSPAEISVQYGANVAGKTVVGPYLSSPPVLPDGAYGVAYSQTLSSARGTGTVNFTILSGSLPAGLAFNSQGVLAGTPTNSGTFNFTVRATDSSGLFADQPVSLRIAAPVAPTAGLVSWWRAEGDATDAIGTNHGVALNGTGYGPGKVGQAFVLDGINDVVAVPDSPTLRPSSLTIDCWVRFDANPGTSVIMAKPLGSGILDSFALWLQNGTLNGVISANNGSAPVLSVPFVPALEQWYHMAFTFDGYSRQQVLYLNNVEMAAGIADRGIAYDTNAVFLGCDSDYGSRAWFVKGRIDEASLYNRALTAKEITDVYYAGAAGKSTTAPFFTTGPSLPDAVNGRAYTQALLAAHGTGQLSFTTTSGGLPSGLNLSPAGVISGTPSGAGTFSFVARVTDAAGQYSEQAYTLSVFTPINPPAGMVGWWRGENSARDELGFHNGTLQGSASYGPGRIGSAFNLDGNNSYVDLGAWSAGTNWTLEAWVNPSSFPPGRHTIVGSLNNCLDWGLEMTDGQLGAQIRPPGGCSSFLGSGVFPSAGFWYHVAFTSDGTNASIYVNGVLLGVAPVDSNYLGNSNGLRIGSSVCCGEFFPGLVDEVSVYNRALLPSEVASIYSAGAGGKTAGTVVPSTTPPTLSALFANGNTLVISFNTNPGNPYTLEYQDLLGANSWTALTNFTASGTNFIFNYSLPNVPQRFLRARTSN